ncbi:MAG: hypothetical protein ACK5C5_05710 [Bacteroidota bacterium]|jgi:hypothetical protein
MKKIILTTVMALSTAVVFGQLKTDAGTFVKPEAKSTMFEINFAPDLTGQSMFSLPFLAQGSDIVVVKARKFRNENNAIRAMANLAIKSEEGSNNTTIALGLGSEKHYAGRERLSTYFGYGGGFGFNSDTQEGEPTFDFDTGEEEEGESFTTTTIALSVGLFAGFDYYIMPDIYLGLEINYGLGVNSVSPEGGEAATSFMLAPGVSPALRLGWRMK